MPLKILLLPTLLSGCLVNGDTNIVAFVEPQIQTTVYESTPPHQQPLLVESEYQRHVVGQGSALKKISHLVGGAGRPQVLPAIGICSAEETEYLEISFLTFF